MDSKARKKYKGERKKVKVKTTIAFVKSGKQVRDLQSDHASLLACFAMRL
jgi:hypothetical protein